MKLEQAKEKIKEILNVNSICDDYDVDLKYDGTILEINAHKMYSYVDVQFSHLQAISEMFQTKDINIGDRWHLDGCETCDHGSKYNLTIYVSKLGTALQHGETQKKLW